MDAFTALQSFWESAGGNAAALDQISFTGETQQLPSRYPVGALAAGSIAAQALAAAELWCMRGGVRQKVSVDRRHALAMFRSDRYLRLNGAPAPDPWSPIAGYYQAGDGRWLQLHTNFPHHSAGVVRQLGCGDSRDEVAAAIRDWQAEELVERLSAVGMCASLARSRHEWLAHAQAQAIAALPLMEIIKIGEAPVQPLPGGRAGRGDSVRPLSGIRVLDLSRVIAAPVGARTLAQHGADVLAVSAAHLPNIDSLLLDTGRGKRSTQLDLRTIEGKAQLDQLLRGADIYLQAYRPGALEARGYTTERLAELRPGLVQVHLSAYGHAGPWAGRRGFDSLVQTASGIACSEAGAGLTDMPGKLPCQALDHATGYLAALGAMLALQRRAREGGSWLVRLSLAQTGHWLAERQLGVREGDELSAAEVASWMQTTQGPQGRVSAIRPVEEMQASPVSLDIPSEPLGTSPPVWRG
jgi:crotonobetainyl-CoA:carnitine CoA-transferase CaiB-like acyl-CoA transferase